MTSIINTEPSIKKNDKDLQRLQRIVPSEGAAFQDLLRIPPIFISGASLLTFRWKAFCFDPEMRVARKIKYGILASFMIGMWMPAAGVHERNLNPISLAICNEYNEYLSVVDDLIDSSKNSLRLTFTQNNKARAFRKTLFSLVSELPNEKEVKKIIYQSGHTMARAEARLKREGVSDLESAIRLCSETTGEAIRSLVAILNVTHNVPKGTANEMEQCLPNLGVALQLYDDLVDFAGDMRNKASENLLFQILRMHPDELKRIEAHLAETGKISKKQFAKLAPESVKFAKKLQNGFLSKIPNISNYYIVKVFLRMAYGI